MYVFHVPTCSGVNGELLIYHCCTFLNNKYSKGAVQEHIRFDELSQCSWYQDLGTKILVPRSWYQDLGTEKNGEPKRRSLSVCRGGKGSGGLEPPQEPQGVWGGSSLPSLIPWGGLGGREPPKQDLRPIKRPKCKPNGRKIAKNKISTLSNSLVLFWLLPFNKSDEFKSFVYTYSFVELDKKIS